MRHARFARSLAAALASGFFLSTLAVSAIAAEADKPAANRLGTGQPPESVKLFDGVKAKKIEVRFIPKDSTTGRILITNKTEKPLRVELPKAAGAVQVLAQMGGMGGGTANRGGMMGGMQSMGMGMGGGMGMRGGMGGGMFDVAPERVAEIRVPCVCLEHGKAEPRSTATYELRPIESVTTKPGVRELCSLLGQIPQHVAQAVAWHLNNDMSWQQLAAKRIQRATGVSYPYFNLVELNMAVALTKQVLKAAESQPKETSPSPGSIQTVTQARPAADDVAGKRDGN